MRSSIVDSLGKAPARLSVSPIAISPSLFTIARSFGLIAASFIHHSFRSNYFQYLEAVILTRWTVKGQNGSAIDTALSVWHKKTCPLRGCRFPFVPALQISTRYRTFSSSAARLEWFSRRTGWMPSLFVTVTIQRCARIFDVLSNESLGFLLANEGCEWNGKS